VLIGPFHVEPIIAHGVRSLGFGQWVCRHSTRGMQCKQLQAKFSNNVAPPCCSAMT
jgi:hypothetical protein